MTRLAHTLPLTAALLLLGLAAAPAIADEDGDELGNGVETRLEMGAELDEDCEAALTEEFESEAERREAMDVCFVVAEDA